MKHQMCHRNPLHTPKAPPSFRRFHEYYEDIMKHYHLQLKDAQGVETGWPSLDQLYKASAGLAAWGGLRGAGREESTCGAVAAGWEESTCGAVAVGWPDAAHVGSGCFGGMGQRRAQPDWLPAPVQQRERVSHTAVRGSAAGLPHSFSDGCSWTPGPGPSFRPVARLPPLLIGRVPHSLHAEGSVLGAAAPARALQL